MQVAYYYKKKTKYPERIYVLYDYWPERNLLPMGLTNEKPFLTRSSTPYEDEALEGALRLVRYQYDDPAQALLDEKKIAGESHFHQLKAAMLQAVKGRASKDFIERVKYAERWFKVLERLSADKQAKDGLNQLSLFEKE